MLVTCPECGAKISGEAHPCPYCGLPGAGVGSKEVREIETKKYEEKKKRQERTKKCVAQLAGRIKELGERRYFQYGCSSCGCRYYKITSNVHTEFYHSDDRLVIYCTCGNCSAGIHYTLSVDDVESFLQEMTEQPAGYIGYIFFVIYLMALITLIIIGLLIYSWLRS